MSFPLSMPIAGPLSYPIAQYEGGGPYAPEANALFSRFTTPPTDARKVIINNLIVTLIAAGVWPKLDAFYMLAAADSQAARQNWIVDLYNLTPVASPSFVADRGYTGDGATSYLESGFNISTAPSRKFLQDDASLGVDTLTDVQSNTAFDIGTSGAYAAINARRTGSLARFFSNTNAIQDIAISPDTSIKETAFSRTGGAMTAPYRSGIPLATNSVASQPVISLTMRLCAAGGFFSTRQNAGGFWGGALSDAQMLALYNARKAYLFDLGVTI